ncbi:MAG: phage integrase N-terminal SAM-like domain-containing protein, partial [Gemmatimonadetes bacterium]|nr:phage integrase N-terminal SAM-like domain-containing protein [Gemmatimonadota bacterium]
MEGNEGGPARPHAGAAADATAVHVRLRDGRLELRFQRRFSQADLEAVKAIPGRRWHPERRIWLLPHKPESLSALTRSFGSRLVLPETPPASAGVAAGAHTLSAEAASMSRETYHRAVDGLLDAMRRANRTREYSRKTERAYLGWARRFCRFHAGAVDGPENRDGSHAGAFLEHLAT